MSAQLSLFFLNINLLNGLLFKPEFKYSKITSDKILKDVHPRIGIFATIVCSHLHGKKGYES